VNAVGVGAFSMPIKVTTRALPPFPPALELVNVGSNSVKLKWGDGKNVDMLRYVLEMRRDDYGRFVVGHFCTFDAFMPLVGCSEGKFCTSSPR